MNNGIQAPHSAFLCFVEVCTLFHLLAATLQPLGERLPQHFSESIPDTVPCSSSNFQCRRSLTSESYDARKRHAYLVTVVAYSRCGCCSLWSQSISALTGGSFVLDGAWCVRTSFSRDAPCTRSVSRIAHCHTSCRCLVFVLSCHRDFCQRFPRPNHCFNLRHGFCFPTLRRISLPSPSSIDWSDASAMPVARCLVHCDGRRLHFIKRLLTVLVR